MDLEPIAPAQILTWLQTCLGSDVVVTGAERIGADYGFASEIFRVGLTDAEVSSVVLKVWPLESRASDRELHFYRDLAPACDIRLPRFFGGGIDESRAFILLEDLSPVRQGDVLVSEDEESLLRLTTSLADLHASHWGLTDPPSWLVDARKSSRTPEWFTSRTEAFLDRFDAPSEPVAAALLPRLEHADSVASGLLDQSSSTVIHGDFHLDNVVFATDGSPIIVDWAGVAVGPPVIDLASLLFEMASPEQFGALVNRYLERLDSRGVVTDRIEFMEQVSAAMVRKFMMGTLGMATWQPSTTRGESIASQAPHQAEIAIGAWHQQFPTVIDRVLSS